MLNRNFLVFYKDSILMFNEDCFLPENLLTAHKNWHLNESKVIALGKLNSQNLFAIDDECFATMEDSDNFCFKPLRDFLTSAPHELTQLILSGKQLSHWHNTSLFCGQCGSPTIISQIEVAKNCPNCKRIIYPSTHPVVIVLVKHQNKVLLARSPHFTPGVYSVLAGFVEPGESCEDAIHREIKEEVGLAVKDICYYGSQAWPFPNSYMMGFIVNYAEGELHIDHDELEDAKWFTIDNLPPLPSKLSIARAMIDSFIDQMKSTKKNS